MKIDIRKALDVDHEKKDSIVDVREVIEEQEEAAEELEHKAEPVEEPEIEKAVKETEAETEEPEMPCEEETVDEPEAPAEETVEESEVSAEEPEEEPEEESEEESEEEPEETPAEELEAPAEESEKESEAPVEESEEEPEDALSEESEEVSAEKATLKERVSALCRKYGSLAAIGAAFAALMIVLMVYTTMIPREVSAVIDGEEMKFTTRANTIESFLKAEKIDFCEEDYASLSLTAFIRDGLEFEIRHAMDFQVTADGETAAYKSLKETVGAALKDVGIKVGEDDIVEPEADEALTADMKIVVKRVTYKEEVEEEVVEFETEKKDDPSMAEGKTKVITEGKDGKDKVTYKVKYIDGEEADREEIERETIEEAVDEVIANGTRIDYNGKSYSKKITVKAYAYTGGGRTAMGTRARVGEIAVDPSVIPLGTNVYIEGVGARRAEDTGGNIKGNTIDIYMNSESECRRWGVRYVTVYIE